MNTRVAIVGAGAVGASCAYALALNGSCSEIILYDIIPDIAIGKAIDISQSTLYSKRKTNIRAITEPSEMEDCDIVVITAGVPRKKDMTRADLLKINAGIVKEVALNIKKYSPNAIIISVSNPLDVMNYVVYRVTGWDRSRVIGMSGALDRARMAYEIYKKVGFGATQINAMVIGEHGEHMIPYPQLSNVDGINLTSMLSPEEIEEVVENTKSGGAQIVKYLKTSAYYAPGRAIAIMVEAILENRDIVVPSSVILEGEYGYEDISIWEFQIVLGKTSGSKRFIIDIGDLD